jgi:prepilin-type N-terminal cleavage/methylation domain-containing protein
MNRAFTLIEIVIAVAIAVMLLLLAVPSLNGVLANRRLRHSLDRFNGLVHQAQERSVTEHRAYLIIWGDKDVELRPEVVDKEEEGKPTDVFPLARGEELTLTLPAALTKHPAQWIFWPSGICEPAIVQFKGPNGSWKADYSALTARANLLTYVAR